MVVKHYLGRDVEQHDSAFTPTTNPLGPETRPAIKSRFDVLIREEVPFSLHKTKSARIEIVERAHLEITRIVQRTPELLALTIIDRQTIRIVHRRAKVIDILAVVRAEKEHACH